MFESLPSFKTKGKKKGVPLDIGDMPLQLTLKEQGWI